MFKFEKEKEYIIRLMPNFKTPTKSSLGIKIMYNEDVSIKRIFSFILYNDKVQVCKLPIRICEYIPLFMTGDVSFNSNGLILGNSRINSYEYNEDGYLITSENNDYKFSDIEYINKPYNLYDIQNGYEISFTIEDKDGFIKYDNFIFKKNDKPLYKNGDNKENIIKLYDSINDLSDYLDEYIKELKINSPDIKINFL